MNGAPRTAYPPAPRSPALLVRLALARDGQPHRVDGVWWPRTRDLTVELPSLLAELDRVWGRITRVTADTGMWLPSPRRMPLADRVVHINWSGQVRDRHTVCLLSLGVGRCDLMVLPPATPANEARRLMDEARGTPEALSGEIRSLNARARKAAAVKVTRYGTAAGVGA